MKARQFNVSKKLKAKLIDIDEDTVNTSYKCNVKVQLAGDSFWDVDCKFKTVTIKSICISETDCGDGETSIHIAVAHTGGLGSWQIYTDSGFESAVSDLLGCEVTFTEQGMQDDGCASMEL